MCLHQTGSDFYGQAHPLFSLGLGGGYYTAPYLYGELLFTSIFGNSIYAFRAFMALVTTGTIFFLFQWLKKRTSLRIAMLAVLFASISPWVFQFSRIAWDPPLAPFFLVLGLWFFDLKNAGNWVWGALAIALAGYSYPPCRIQAVILLFALPGMSWKRKIQIFAVFALATLPMLYRAFEDPYFTARAKMLALNSSYSMNPYRDAGPFGLALGFIVQFFEHFTPAFLLLKGDSNIRHSTGAFGILSYPEAILLFSGFVYFVVQSVRKKSVSLEPLFVFALIGMAAGIAPAALTWESVPHALRSIGAWPFFAMLAALTTDCLLRKVESKSVMWGRWFRHAIWASAMLFAALFFHFYYTSYPSVAEQWFQDDQTPLGSAYRKMTEYQVFCRDIRDVKLN